MGAAYIDFSDTATFARLRTHRVQVCVSWVGAFPH